MSSSTPQQQLIAYIHHERQEAGSMLCAQHALNALLQGQYYDPSQLSQIATELDQLEASELGLSQADIAARDRSSLNMDDTGFFSVSVLERALQVWGISISSWRSAEMRARHDAPEREAAFVLNLNSHWFTIRSFGTTSKFWYNLNSFLAEPQWIGNNYLGTLLHTAESEGYSVFVVQASEGSAGQGLRESDADQIADHLPPPGASSASNSSNSASLGLQPSATSQKPTIAPVSNASEFRSPAPSFGLGGDEDDAELQAALSASLLQHTSSATAPDTPSRSRVRQVRGGSAEDTAGGDSFMGETDADIDAIAPSRRRHRAAFPDPVDDDLRRAMEASLSSSSSRPSGASGSIPVPVATSSSSSSTSSRPVGRRKRRAQERQTGLSRDDAIDLDDSRGDDTLSSDVEELHPSSLSHRSPFLSPAMAAANLNNEDVEEIVDDDDEIASDDDLIDPFSVPGAPEASAVIGPRQDRHYDDEDAELQAALAASLGDTEAAARFTSENPNYRNATRRSEEQQTAIPDDVDRITKMREEAKRKAREEQERQERLARGEPVEDEEQGSSNKANASGVGGAGAGDADDDDDEESEAEEVSAEEMRRRRLARFG
ncbi:Ubiquitinyl hydrolase 1 [Pseudozyma hubeiensis]|nr:Ubiquitinyl hydrolase 1 [Pseudozyma hubeiensis]